MIHDDENLDTADIRVNAGKKRRRFGIDQGPITILNNRGNERAVEPAKLVRSRKALSIGVNVCTLHPAVADKVIAEWARRNGIKPCHARRELFNKEDYSEVVVNRLIAIVSRLGNPTTAEVAEADEADHKATLLKLNRMKADGLVKSKRVDRDMHEWSVK